MSEKDAKNEKKGGGSLLQGAPELALGPIWAQSGKKVEQKR